MKRAMILLAALAVTLGSASVSAQGRPQRPPRPAPPAKQPPPPPPQARPETGRPAQPGQSQGQAHGQGQEERTVAAHLARNTKLAERLEKDLPAGANVQEAAAGFKNLGQFVATVQASKNLEIEFDQLKGMVTMGNSLGDAIHKLKPEVDAKAEEKKANREAEKIIRESGS